MIRDHSAYSVDPGELVCSPMLERIATKWDVLQRLQDSKKADHAEELAEVSEDWAAFVADVKARVVAEIDAGVERAKRAPQPTLADLATDVLA